MTKLLLTITAVFSLSLLLPGNSFTAFSQEDFTGGQGYLIADGVPHAAPAVGIITAYTARTEETDDSPTITASNQIVREGIIANNCLPFGAKVKIDGREYEVQDRMNKRYDCNHYDIYFEDLDEAKIWGVKKLSVEI